MERFKVGARAIIRMLSVLSGVPHFSVVASLNEPSIKRMLEALLVGC